MSVLYPIPLAGFASLNDPHLNTLGEALIVSDCDTDHDAVEGRGGSRSALPGAISGSGVPQLFIRFRPSAQSQRFVAVIGGSIYLVTDPTSETASDGTVTLLMASAYSATENVCAAQLNASMYIVNETTPAVAYRITSDYTLHLLASLPQAVQPTFTLSSLAVTKLNGLSTTGSTLTPSASGVTDWINFSGTIGNVAIYTFATPFNLASIGWLMVACSPETLSGGGGTFKIEVGNAGGSYVSLGTISDPPNTNGSPWVYYASLLGLDPSVLGAVTKIRFTQLGPTTDPFTVYGVMPIPTAPEPGTVNYIVTYRNSVTGVESVPSTAIPVVYNNSAVTYPTFLTGHWNYNTFQNIGVKSSNPDTQTTSDNFNKGAGFAYPAASDFASVYTFNGNIPTGAQYNNADTVRLYRSTANGYSLVGSSVYSTDGTGANAKRADGTPWTTGTGTDSDLPANVTYWQATGTTWSITDNTGSAASENLTYTAGGPFPPSTQMTAYRGRLASIYQNQVSISSFTPVGTTTNPVPEWPPIALNESDGWAYDVSPSPTEIGYCVDGDGDALYIGTTACVRSMSDVSPDSPPFVIMRRGVIGRYAYGFYEQQFFWASWDGVYMSVNQSSVVELTEPIRTYYTQTFQPDGTVNVRYQDRKLYVFKGRSYLRFDFVKKRWSTGTIADTMVVSQNWTDVTGVQNNNFIVDTFSGGTVTLASHTPDVGGAWTKVTGSLGFADVGALNNVRGHNALPDSSALYYSNTTPPSADYTVSLQIQVASTPVSFLLGPQLCGRVDSAAGSGTFYALNWAFNGNFILKKQVSGTSTQLGSQVTIAPVVGQTKSVQLVMAGNQISAIVDGVTIIGPITDSAITAAGFAGLFFGNNDPAWTDTADYQGKNFTAGSGTITRTRADQFWFIPTTRFLGRWQPTCRRDMEIGTDATTGTAIPDWVYRTGFSIAPEPNTVNGVMLDASGPVQVQIAKVADALIPTSARNLPLTVPFSTIDENWYPGAPDLRGYKMSFRFQGGNDVVLRRAMYEAGILPGTKGG